ncbi:MBL fold metallo-hydrolase [Chloroflexota bacterium]
MISEVCPGIFRHEVPLPGNPLKTVNSYLVKGENRSLLVDTGFDKDECRKIIDDNLATIGADMAKTDIFITHIHADHLGLASALATPNSKVYFGHKEAAMSAATPEEKETWWKRMADRYTANGFPQEILETAFIMHPGKRFGGHNPVTYTRVADGDHIQAGDYNFTVVETPGHSPLHCCLYEPEKKILFSGDHILGQITPNITWWQGMENSLARYIESLDKIYPLEINLVLPGHRKPFTNHRRRIEQIKQHHESRCQEVMQALAEGEKNVYQIAPSIAWNVGFGNWDVFPVPQKWFAFGEAMAHLEYLKYQGKVTTQVSGGINRYALAANCTLAKP